MRFPSSILILVGATSFVASTPVGSNIKFDKRATSNSTIADVLAQASSLNYSLAYTVCAISHQTFLAVAALGIIVPIPDCAALTNSTSADSTSVSAPSATATNSIVSSTASNPSVASVGATFGATADDSPCDNGEYRYPGTYNCIDCHNFIRGVGFIDGSYECSGITGEITACKAGFYYSFQIDRSLGEDGYCKACTGNTYTPRPGFYIDCQDCPDGTRIAGFPQTHCV